MAGKTIKAARVLDEEESAASVFGTWIGRLSTAIADNDAKAFSALFTPDATWRDFLSFSWERRAFRGDEIRDAFERANASAGITDVQIAPTRTPPRFERRSGYPVVEGWFEFKTAVGAGAGFVRLALDDAGQPPKARMFLTTLQSLSGFEERSGEARPSGDHYSRIESSASWAQEHEREQAFVDRDPEVIVVGAGQSGLILAARLRQMGIDALVIERTKRVGDVWRGRYNNLTLHNKLSANHFPYLQFPTTWPVWLPKDMLADWLEGYAKFLELNVWTDTSLESSEYDEASGRWRIELARGDGNRRTLHAPHLVISTGVSGNTPKRPKLAGLNTFKGKVLHSSEFTSGAEWAGKRALVIGTGNSGHDIAQDLYVSGAETVTMMQRGPTCVLSLEPSASLSYNVYSEGCAVEDIDLMVAAIPYDTLIDTYRWLTQSMKKADSELIAGLQSVGFKTYNGADETGFQLLYLRGAGGYYINVGCSELLIDRKIGLVQHEDIASFEEGGLRMQDGRLVPLDLVVLATGFESIAADVSRLVGKEVSDRVGPVWGFDSEGNVRNMWTRTAQPGLWLMGGALLEARLNSRFLALEIKASLLGLLPPRDKLAIQRRPAPAEPVTA